MDGALTENLNVARSPAREKANGALSGDEVQPAGSRSATLPRAPTAFAAGATLLTISTRTSKGLSRDASGTIAVRGVTLTTSAGTTASSCSTVPYGSWG